MFKPQSRIQDGRLSDYEEFNVSQSDTFDPALLSKTSSCYSASPAPPDDNIIRAFDFFWGDPEQSDTSYTERMEQWLALGNEDPSENIKRFSFEPDSQAPTNEAPPEQIGAEDLTKTPAYLPVSIPAEQVSIDQVSASEFISIAARAGLVNSRQSSSNSVAGAKKFPCTKCNKGFTRANDLKRHMAIHNNVNLWQCPQCNKGFRQQSNWKQHMDTHNKVRFPCLSVGCGEHFGHKSQLSTHSKKHPELQKTSARVRKAASTGS